MFRCGILPTYHASRRNRKSFWNLPGHDFGFVCVIGFRFCPRLVRSYSLAWVWGLRIFVGVVLCSSAPGSGKPARDIYRFVFGERYTDGWDSLSPFPTPPFTHPQPYPIHRPYICAPCLAVRPAVLLRCSGYPLVVSCTLVQHCCI